MRIGIDCRMYSSRFTGIGRYVFELTKNLFALDRSNEYVLFFNEPEFSSFQPLEPRIKKVLVNARHYSLKEQIHFLRAINNERLDLMHFTHFNAPIFYRKPSVVTIHDLTLSFFPGKKMTSFIHRAAYNITLSSAVKKAKKIIAVSKNTKKDLQTILKTDSKKISVIYEGVDEEFKKSDPKTIENVLKKYEIRNPYLLYTGVWRSHKNLSNLIHAFNILKKDYQYPGQLVITGNHDPSYAPEIFSLVADFKLGNDIIFTGMVEDHELIPLYSGAQVYVFPSLYEGFGLPPLEAMQCETPVATSNSSCLPEICGKDNALFFDPKDPHDIAEKVFRLASETTLREKLIRNGLQHVKNFSWQTMAQETLHLYKEIFS